MTGGYGKSISHVIIGLKTVRGTKQLKLDPTIYDALVKEKVRPLGYVCFPVFGLEEQILMYVKMELVLLLRALCMSP